MMEEHLTDEHLFVQDVLRDRDITVTQLAQRAGLADSTVYEYTGGRRKNIPMVVWRALFELTEDVRIPNLVMGEARDSWSRSRIRIRSTPMNPRSSNSSKNARSIWNAIAILDILADGKIDRADNEAIHRYRDAHPEAMKLEAQIYYTIMAAYEKSTHGKGQR
jgi:hypothetical protein